MTIISAIIMLGILIFVHELGHFIVAKLMRVSVLKFSLGFGPRLFGRKIGETEYMISAVPLGGYVKMLGEDIGEDFPEADKARAFQFQPVGRRALIVLAGPAFNIALTYVIYTTLLAAHLPVHVPDMSSLMPVIEGVAPSSPAERAGLQAGDRVVRLNGREIETYVDVEQTVMDSPGKEVVLLVRRGGDVREFRLVPDAVAVRGDDKPLTIGRAGIEKYNSPVVGEVRSGTPADRAGIETGDRVLRIDGREIFTWIDMVQVIRESPGRPLRFTVQRGGATFERVITPEAEEVSGRDGKVVIGRIGIQKADRYFRPVESRSAVEALWKGAVATFRVGRFVFDTIAMLFTGEVSVKSIGGPVTIVKESGKAASAGILPYFVFMALFSVNLGVLNLLPVPILDGGHLLFFLIERVKGSPLNEKAVLVLNRVGLALLVALMVVAFYNDLMRLFGLR